MLTRKSLLIHSAWKSASAAQHQLLLLRKALKYLRVSPTWKIYNCKRLGNLLVKALVRWRAWNDILQVFMTEVLIGSAAVALLVKWSFLPTETVTSNPFHYFKTDCNLSERQKRQKRGWHCRFKKPLNRPWTYLSCERTSERRQGKLQGRERLIKSNGAQ